MLTFQGKCVGIIDNSFNSKPTFSITVNITDGIETKNCVISNKEIERLCKISNPAFCELENQASENNSEAQIKINKIKDELVEQLQKYEGIFEISKQNDKIISIIKSIFSFNNIIILFIIY